ncbi:MAG: YigZ family protein [Calditrichaeota bacterium]|nr:YigZ family protein [Calditrichota bacterium]
MPSKIIPPVSKTLGILVPDGESEFRLSLRGSKFLAWAIGVGSEDEAKTALAARSRRHHDATHNCWAYFVGDGADPVERCSDEGEPSGTAGRPILHELQKAKMRQVLVVVSRWFGGTKLETARLIRAYSAATAGAIELLPKRAVERVTSLVVEADFDHIGRIERIAGKVGGRLGDCSYCESGVFVKLTLPYESADRFRELLVEEQVGRSVEQS